MTARARGRTGRRPAAKTWTVRRGFPCAVLALLALVAAHAGASAGRPSPAAVAEGFFRTVFGLEYGAHPDADTVKRFDGPVLFHITDRSGRERLGAARRFVASLPRRIRHFRGREVASRRAANFHILLVRQAAFPDVVARELKADALAMNARCIVGVTTREGRIEKALAIIVADDDALFARCLVEEVLQGLGPMNDSSALPASVFNDTSRHAVFTRFDEAILNVLYHPAIRPGMSRRQARGAIPRALRDLGYAR